MALDRDRRSLPYVTGRMIAITEHYAGNRFGPNTLGRMFTHPQDGVNVWRRYINTSDEYYQELKDINFPVTMYDKVEQSQAWVGYYHQKSRLWDITAKTKDSI